jgi:hypothetical protein
VPPDGERIMVLHDEQAPKPKGAENEAERDQLLAQARKEALCRDMSTPRRSRGSGAARSERASIRERAILGIGVGINDPELARMAGRVSRQDPPELDAAPAVVASASELRRAARRPTWRRTAR